MGLSVLGIYQSALNAAGGRSDISSMSERSREGELCRHWYPIVRGQVFAAAHWSCGRAAHRLTLLAARGTDEWDNTRPMPPWTYAYALPSDFVHPRHLNGYGRFELGRHGEHRALFTEEETPILIYTRNEENTALWDELLDVAVFTAMAGMIISPLSGSRRKAMSLLEDANRILMQAREKYSNQDHAPVEAVPDWLIARGYGGPSNPNRYIYPVGPLFVTGTSG